MQSIFRRRSSTVQYVSAATVILLVSTAVVGVDGCLSFLRAPPPLACNVDEGLCDPNTAPGRYCGIDDDGVNIREYGNQCKLDAGRCRAQEAGRTFPELRCYAPVPGSSCSSRTCPTEYDGYCALNMSDTSQRVFDYGNKCVFEVMQCSATLNNHFITHVNC